MFLYWFKMGTVLPLNLIFSKFLKANFTKEQNSISVIPRNFVYFQIHICGISSYLVADTLVKNYSRIKVT